MTSSPPSPNLERATLPAMLLACALPLLVAYSLTPTATLFNQLAALSGWGLCLWLLAESGLIGRSGDLPWQESAAPLALLLLLLAALASPLWTGLPLSASLASAALLAAALATLLAGLGFRDRERGMDLLAWALLAAGVASVLISLIQVFMPEWADGSLIARSGIPGRAVGNMRQPNHLASLLMWGCVAAVWLADAGRFGGATRPGRALRLAVLPLLLFALVFAVVLSASRTGMLGVLLLALWGALDRKLARASRWALATTPLMLALSWALMAAWAAGGEHAFGAEARLAEGAGSPSRLAILANTWALIRQHPLTGVGWGEFNLAWTMTPFPDRPVAFFDHSHNLPMQLLVELGAPLGLLVLALLARAIWQSFAASQRAAGREAVARRSAFMVVLMIGLHSLLEYPLWYAYFLLPAAFALGLGLGGSAPDAGPGPGTASPRAGLRLPRAWPQWAGVALLVGSGFAVWDYLQVVAIYVPPAHAAPLEQRIERGQQSVFFAAQADYAAATSLPPGPTALAATRRTAHHLIDARLMMAWAKSLHIAGDDELARHVVQRLHEFRNAAARDWLAECDAEPGPGNAPGSGAAADAPPFQCRPPERTHSFKELR